MSSTTPTTSSRHLFNGVFSCFLRHNEFLGRAAAAKKGPSQVLDEAIPVIIYGDPSYKSGNFSENRHDDSEFCSICLAKFISGEPLKVLPKCGHMFHQECIDQWLPSRSLHCPVCRDRAVERHREPERNDGCRRSQWDTADASALLALNFANSATRYSII